MAYGTTIWLCAIWEKLQQNFSEKIWKPIYLKTYIFHSIVYLLS